MAKSMLCESDILDITHRLWKHFNNREWDLAENLLSKKFEADWPQTRERIIGPHNFIELNRRYPGEHRIELLMKQYVGFDDARKHRAVTQVYIESIIPGQKEMKLFAISFFKIAENGLIEAATEYWADMYDAPDWRKDLVEKI